MSEIKEVVNYSLEDMDEISDRENRRLYLNNDVDECVIDTFVYMIMKYNREDKGKPVEERKPIILYINSPGGSVCDGYGLIDAMLSSITPVYTVNQAQCCSMGFLIFLAGKKRYTMEHSQFLMHDGSTWGAGSVSKVKDRIEFETVELEAMTKRYILQHTNMTEKFYDEKYRMEFYFLPSVAKKLGVADYIVGVDCGIDEIL